MELTEKKYGVFISYSHADVKLVSPIVQLISSMRKDLIFQDITGLIPGQKWENQLTLALEQAEMIVVFWCRHSSKSKEVQKECDHAIELKKHILPVLLDKSKLNQTLSSYQWIDLTGSIYHKKKYSWMSYILYAIFIVAFFQFLANIFSWGPEELPHNDTVNDSKVVYILGIVLLVGFLAYRITKRILRYKLKRKEILAASRSILTKLNEKLPPLQPK